jgi:uncharacterized protein YycO
MSIRIQIVTEKWNPVSAAIRFSTRSWASHAEFVNLEAGTTLGARCTGGVQVRPCSWDHYSRIEQFSAPNISHAYEWALAQVGKPYDFAAVTGIALDRNWRSHDKWFCSELIAAAFENIGGIPLLSTRPSVGTWRITPRDLLLSRNLYYLGGKNVD